MQQFNDFAAAMAPEGGPSPEPLVWIIGESDDACFAPAISWLHASARFRRFASIAQARQFAREPHEPAHGIVFCALRPGQVDADSVEALHRAAPLASLVLLLGSWCEGEVRSGRTIPGVVRIYWHQWRHALPAALGLPTRDRSLPPRLPRAASEADRLEHSLCTGETVQREVLVAICTDRAAMFDTLAEAVAAGGFRAAWQPPLHPLQVRGADVCLWDGWPVEPLETYTSPSPEGPAAHVLLLDFPREHDRRRALSLGAAEIVSRPFQLPELWATIDAADQSRRETKPPRTKTSPVSPVS